MSLQTRKEIEARKLRVLLEEGCHHNCDYDEPEGGLLDHCNSCKTQITTIAYELFVRQKGRIPGERR